MTQSVFNFLPSNNGQAERLRVVTLKGSPWFYLVDVCRVVGIGNASDVARRLDDDEKMTLDSVEGGKINGLGSIGAMPTIINESGLYSLILASRKPYAKEFKRWITGTVIPSIREHGIYVMGQEKVATGEATLEQLTQQAADSWKSLTDALKAQLERVTAEKLALGGQVVIMAPLQSSIRGTQAI